MKKTALMLLFSGLLLSGVFSVYADNEDMPDSQWGQPQRAANTTPPAGSTSAGSAQSAPAAEPSATPARAAARATPTQEQLEHWRDTMLYGTPSQKEDALRTMQNFRTKDVDDLLIETLKTEEEGPNQRRIIQLLHDRQIEGALAPLEEALKKAQEPATMASIISTIGKFKDKATLPLLLTYVTNNDPTVQQEAVRALGAIGDPKPAAQFLEMLDTLPTTHDLRYDLINALGDFKYAPAYDSLRSIAMNSANAQFLRAFAITALGKIGDKRILPDFLRLLNEEPNPTIKLRVVAAFGDIPSEETIAAIQRGMADADGQVRAAAVTAAGKTGNKDLVNALLFRFRTDSETRVMLAAAEALHEFGHADLPRLLLARVEGTRDIHVLSRLVALLKKCPPQPGAAAMLRRKQEENRNSRVRDEIQELINQWGIAGSPANETASPSATRPAASAQADSQPAEPARILITE
jgi:hypothetical protein